MIEIFLNIIPQHLIRTGIRRIIKHIQTFGVALKELRNCILRTILVWSLFYLIRVYASLYFISIFGKLVFLSFYAFCVYCLF